MFGHCTGPRGKASTRIFTNLFSQAGVVVQFEIFSDFIGIVPHSGQRSGVARRS